MKHTVLRRNTIISSVKREYFYSAGDLRKAKGLLERYLRGEKVSFNIRLCLESLSPFTRRVLQKVRAIPYGETKSYHELSRELGMRGGSRAIGQALKRNPLPVIIPCHRVIRNNGEIGGFSRGIVIKKKLLDMEKERVKPAPGRVKGKKRC